jgi:hypothetical protein
MVHPCAAAVASSCVAGRPAHRNRKLLQAQRLESAGDASIPLHAASAFLLKGSSPVGTVMQDAAAENM